jgi:hypothetical protein
VITDPLRAALPSGLVALDVTVPDPQGLLSLLRQILRLK